MSAKRGVMDGIAYSTTASSDPESDSSLCAEGEDAVITKCHSSCKVQKSTSLRKMKSKIKDLRSLISRYQENEALLVSSTNVMSGEIMDYEIQLAGLYGKMKSIMDENCVLKENWESLSATERRPATQSSTNQEHTLEERSLLAELKRGVSAKLKDCKSIQNTVNAKLDEIHEFYEKYYGEFELHFTDAGFGKGLAQELSNIKLVLENVRKNSQIKVNNLQLQLIAANKSLELLKKDIKVKDDCLKCIPDLVNKTNNALLSYKKNIANQKETIEALQNELSRQLETQGHREAELQAQIPTNVSLIDPFDEVDSAMDTKTKELLAIQEKELQELRSQKHINDQKQRAAQLHLERQDNTIKLLKDYLQSLIQGRQPPQPHLYSFPVEHNTQEMRGREAPKLIRSTPNAPTTPLLLLPQHGKHLDSNSVAVAATKSDTKGSSAQLLLTAPPKEQSPPKDKFRFGPHFNITRPHEFWRQQPRILDQNSPRLLLPTPPNDKLQENAKEDGLSKVTMVESTTPNTPASDPTPPSKTT
ncbi:hypothetical protein N7582_000934 [Saccharomyces uvarum]|uniref:Uncharacterized protein n=1 Tax=Saccharomyces uvarum TaxID=230603 RepID=A0AA35NQQ2_SACUV|nr:hypothetical protein N7582_000934 [Saccharomyces uvarum]CAI4057787.1 hypothetical protein SUVC_04G0450 [Saccharomyces uvarum]